MVLDKINIEMELSWKSRIVCMTGEGLTLFELGSDSDFLNIYTMYNTGERSKKNKIKNNSWTFSPTHQISTKEPTSDKSLGDPDPYPPLDPRT